MKSLTILGSTGSIGTQTLDVVRKLNQADKPLLCVTAMAARGSRPELLAEQVVEFCPRVVAVYDEKNLAAVKRSVDAKISQKQSGSFAYRPVYTVGMKGLVEVSTLAEVDIVVTSLVGMIGIEPTVAAITAGKDIALANKETLVCAGALIKRLSKKYQTRILPVDSEHGAIFQCLMGQDPKDVSRIWLTASGGPFRGFTKQQLEEVTLEQALKHPNWSMGAKITVDSATLMNKGLEMIEAKWLFDREIEDVIPIIHKESLIHSMIEMKDGSVLAQIGPADMRLPIEVALLYPERGKSIVAPLDFRKIMSMSFEEINEEVFPTISMARNAMQLGGLMPAVFNAGGEIAVARFLKQEIRFTTIFAMVEKAMDLGLSLGMDAKEYTLEEVLRVREEIASRI